MDPLTVYLALGTGAVLLNIALTVCFQKEKFAAVKKALRESFQEHLVPLEYRVPVVFVATTFVVSVCVLLWPAVSGYALYRSIRK